METGIARTSMWDEIPDSHWRAYFGKEADYYMTQLRSLRSGVNCSFSWPAFFLGMAWMVYRRLYVIATIALCLTFLIGTIEAVLEELLGVSENAIYIIDKVIGLASGILVGAFANRVYLWYAGRTIREEMAKGPVHVEEILLENIARRGGTSWTAVLVCFGILVLAVMFVVALDVPL